MRAGRDKAVQFLKDKVNIFDQGGWLNPGLSLAYNGTGRPERVSNGPTVQHFHFHADNYVGDKRDLERVLRNLANDHQRRNDRRMF
jgi:hypothetical protein